MKLIHRVVAAVAVGALIGAGGPVQAEAAETRTGSKSCSSGYRPQLKSNGSALTGTVKQSHTWNGSGGSKFTGLITTTTLTSAYYATFTSASFSAYVTTTFNYVTPSCILDAV